MQHDAPQQLDRFINLQHRIRPIRIAFLVERNNDSCNILRSIFKDSYRRWGGRRSLIVPVTAGAITDAYLKWMSRYDPDIVYSYAELTPQTISDIDKQCSPSLFFKHKTRREANDRYWSTPSYDTQPLSAVSLIPSMTAHGQTQQPIISCYPGWDDAEIIADNFGLAESNNDNVPYAPITMTPRGLGKHMAVHGEQVYDEYELFERLGKARSIQSLSFYSSIDTFVRAPAFNRNFTSGLNLFVGDGFDDRLHFWNSRHFNEDSFHSHTPSFWLAEKYLNDDRFMGLFAKYLNTWLYSFPNAQGSGVHVYVQSTTINKDAVEAFSAKMKAAKCWSHFSYRDTPIEPLPDKYRDEPYYFSGYGNQLRINENPSYIIPEEPKYFHAIPFKYNYLKDGDCALDIALERHINHSRIVNKPHLWLLPRRMGISRLFSSSLGRINADHAPSVIYNFFERRHFNTDYSKKKSIAIGFPEDRSVFYASLLGSHPGYYTNDVRYKESVIQEYENFGTSDKGKSLRAVLAIFGDLNAAYHFIENPMWLELIEELSSIKKISDNPSFVARIKEGLKREFGDTLNITNDADWDRLSNKIMPALYHLPKPKLKTSYDAMKGKRNATFNKFLKTAQNGQGFNEPGAREDVLKDFERSLKRLVSMKVFFQGHEWQCQMCGHDNWLSVDNVRLHNECEVCRTSQQIEVKELKWDFLLNPKLGEALYKDDVLAEIWVLGRLLDSARESFYFIPQSEFFKKYDDKQSEFEVDILCVQDGQLIIGEAKTSSSQFNDAAIEKLIKNAQVLLPDKVLLGCLYDDGNINNVKSKLQQAGLTVLESPPLPVPARYDPWSYF